MNSTDSAASSPELISSSTAGVDSIAGSLEKIALQDGGQPDTDDEKKITPSSRPLFIYTRFQILFLYKSPLVNPPAGMPALKDWFGLENEQSINKKDPETPNAASTRDRRFRRDAEDGETPPRPSFRSSLSQPSQMGNFKHQSLRANDREREKDVDKERERDIRDKEGQERLRNLSDKYDRDRLALPAPLSSLRNKERESAPHLAPSSSSRIGTQSQLSSTSSRRSDARDVSGKKKVGEYSEDWRKGAEPPRTTRDERSDTSRKDRDERERPRSRVRDISTSRRDRDRDREDREKERDRDRRLGREREEFRGERDEYRRDRDKDLDRDMELDDPRRWRDDGKRDERIATRREKEYRERLRDRAPHEPGYDNYPERRWTVVEERDARSKRSSGRDRRSGGLPDEGKDREDRKDREREKEKEPAWMDTYVPTGASAGILGGKGAEGELDGIQAWKKGMKEKEKKEKGPAYDTREKETTDRTVGPARNGITSTAADAAPDKELDEIQMFKLMMKREEAKKQTTSTENSQDAILNDLQPAGPVLQFIENGVPGSTTVSAPVTAGNVVSSGSQGTLQLRAADGSGSKVFTKSLSSADLTVPTRNDGPLSLLSMFAPEETSPSPLNLGNPNPHYLDSSLDKSKAPGSRFFPTPLSSQPAPSAPQPSDRTTSDRNHAISPPAQFNPPQSSRLLALGNRTPSTSGSHPSISQSPSSQASAPQAINGQPAVTHQILASQPSHSSTLQGPGLTISTSSSDIPFSHRTSISEALRAQQGFSPFEDPSRAAYGNEQSRDANNFANSAEVRRASTAERLPFGMPSDTGHPYSSDTGSIGKGSRFAKFFDAKGRDGSLATAGKGLGQAGFASPSPIPGQRQDPGTFNGMLGATTDNRTMDDIFAMLNNSAQGQRVHAGTGLAAAPLSAGGPFGQGHNNIPSLQHPQLHQQQPQSRIDSLYESRLDDRHFMPDGLVPGLRSAPPPRNRENNGMFADILEDPMQFNNQRLPPQQRGGLDQMYSGPLPSVYAQQAGVGRNVGMPLQQSQYRGGPSPITGQNPLQGSGQQRLPPGLANLGGRPPHEPSQFMGTPMGLASAGLHGPMHGNGPSQPQYNNFAPGGSIGFGGPQIRGIPPPGPHQLQNSLGHNSMGGMGHPTGIDLRGPSQAPLLAMGGGVGGGGGLRGVGGFGGPQQIPNAQMQGPLVGMRQQQPQAPPHMMPHMLPPHLQQPAGNNQPAHDLMALLMGGPHRE